MRLPKLSAALADDWHRFGNDDERQVCVGLMCAQLRRKPKPDDPDDGEFRRTIIEIIKQHRPKKADPTNESDWRSCKLDLSGADLTSSGGLSSTNFADVSLSLANLRSVWLVGTFLVGAQMMGADLREAFIASADLTRAGLAFADLSGARLYSVNLTEAHLRESNLTGADLSGSNFTGALLDGAQMDGIIYDEKTIWPVGFEPPPSESPPLEYGDLEVKGDNA